MNERKLNKWLGITLVIVFVLWLGVPILIMCKTGIPDSAGEIGDVFGSVNALFTAVAFAFLVYTSLLQREDLRIQKEELELTRKELEKSAEAQKELVLISKSQLRNQKLNRRNQILPIIKIDRDNSSWDSVHRRTFLITLSVENKARFFEIDFMPKGAFKVVYPQKSDLSSALMVEGKFTIQLKRIEDNDSELTNENLMLQFQDLDRNYYSQLIQFISDSKFRMNDPLLTLEADNQ